MQYIDLHCDTIMALMQAKSKESLRNAPFQINLDYLKKGNCLLQCFAMFVNLKKVENPFEYAIQMIDRYYLELEENQDIIAPVLTYEDIERNRERGLISSLLTLEEGAVTNLKLEFFRTFYRLGVRMICLNWNYENGVGHPNFQYEPGKTPDFKAPNTMQGLTDFGIQMVKEMNRLGIIVDVSHLSDKGFYDCLKYSEKPIVASHSNARAICNNVRNLTDDMILKLSENGGVMGMNFCADFLNETEELGKDTISCVIQHMKHIRSLVGVDVIAIGTDFDGIDPDIQLRNASLLPELFSAMKDQGFTEEEIEKIAYKNFLRVLEANIK